MHIGDGLIPLWQCAIYWLIAIIFISASLRWARNDLDEMKIPLLAALAAGIFAIQAMNIPIIAGASGHVVGAVMAAIILGSVWASVLLLTLVLVVQGVLFGDGGITVMGANILSMGIISGFVGFYIYKALKGTLGQFKASFIGGWAGLFISSLVVAVQLFIAGTIPLKEGLMLMGGFHAIIGVGEGLITAFVVRAIASSRPDIMDITEEVVA